MVAWRGVVAAAAVVANVVFCAESGRAQAGATDTQTFLVFAGTDLWRYGGFADGGLLWSPSGLDADGFTFKMLLNGGGYSYVSGALHKVVNGTMMSAAALPGWHFSRGSVAVSLFAGAVAQDYRLTPDDPGSHLRGAYIGGQFAADVWYQPNSATMAALNGAVASIGPTGYLRTALGYRLFDLAFVGPEVEQIWCGVFQELEVGAHVTGLRIHNLDWSAGGGWAHASDHRSGPYLRLGFAARY